MARIQDIDIPYLEFAEAAAPSTPASGIVRIYAKTDGSLYQRDDAGTETGLAGGSSGTIVSDRKVITAGDYTSKNSTTFVDLDTTNLAITLTTGARPVQIGVVCTAALATATQTICLDIDQDGSRLGQTFGLQACDVNHSGRAINMSFTWRTAALSAASHTWKVQYRVTGSSATFYASTTITPFPFWVAELAT